MAQINACFDDHPKVVGLLAEDDQVAASYALALWTLCLTRVSREVRGRQVPSGTPRQMLGDRAEVATDLLCRHGLWESVEEGWRYLDEGSLFQWGALETQRGWIPLWLRKRVHERDGWRCLECGAIDDLTLDHRYPWSLGGEDTEENLRTLCRPCNSRKGARI